MTTGIATSIVPAIRPPKNAPAMTPPEPEPSHEGVQTWRTVAVVPLIWIKASAPLMSAQFLSVVIMSVAVMSPLLLEYATVVVKVALMPSAEHVSWESSRLTEVKLQEHWSRTTPERLSSSDCVLFCSSNSWKSDQSKWFYTARVQAKPVYYGHPWPPYACLLYWIFVKHCDFSAHNEFPLSINTIVCLCVYLLIYLAIYYLLPINLSVYKSISWFMIS